MTVWYNIDDKLPPTGKLVEVKYIDRYRVPAVGQPEVIRQFCMSMKFVDGKRTWFDDRGRKLEFDFQPIYWREVE